MTNADRIRNMTDEELEEMFQKAVFCGGLKAYDCSSQECQGCKLPFCCDIGQWLKTVN